MRKIIRLNMVSALRIFAISYAFIGLYVSLKAAITGAESILAPFGFAYPMVTFYIYLTIHLPQPANALTLGLGSIVIVFYAITGLISGTAVVLLYNWLSSFLPLLSGEVEDRRTAELQLPSLSTQSITQIDEPTTHVQPDPTSPML